MSTKELIYNLDQKWKDATSFLDGPAYSLYNTEYYLLRNLFESMTGEEIKALLPGLRVDGPVYKLASSYLEGKRAPAGVDLTRPLVSTEKRVYSTQQYLKWYADKKGGHVTEARRMLVYSYEFTTNHYRHEIMKAFLRGSATDRKWAYTKLMNTDNWHAMYEPLILENWVVYKELRCSWLLTRYFPEEVLLKYAKGLEINTSYYFLCKRLAGNPAFQVNWQFLKRNTTILRYLEIRMLSGAFCGEDEARELIFQWIAVPLHFRYWVKSGQVDTRNLPDLYYSDYHPLHLEGMDKALFYLCKMGYAGLVQDIYRWADEVVQEVLRMSQAKSKDSDKRKDTLGAVIIMNFPPEYHFMLEFEEWTVFGVVDFKNRPLAEWRSSLDLLLRKEWVMPDEHDDEPLFLDEEEEIRSPEQAASSDALQKMREKNPSLDSFLEQLGY